MSSTVYVPGDAGALSVGAGEVAAAVAAEAKRRGLRLDLVRNGSRGAYWLEPLVEVATGTERVAYGPVRAGDVPSLIDPPDARTRDRSARKVDQLEMSRSVTNVTVEPAVDLRLTY